MPFLHNIQVSESSIDENGHVNNVEYVRWMQDAAIAHADAAGCTSATKLDGATWVARRHSIEYLRPALPGDTVEVKTWISDMRRAASLRRYEMSRSGGTILARGETDWVYVDTATSRPKAIPQHIRDLFEVEE
jgi:acyl-CoA thioester hydrolase